MITAAATPPVPITQNATLPLTSTDFNSGSNIPGNPLVFQQFDTQQGARQLNSVVLTVNASIRTSSSCSSSPRRRSPTRSPPATPRRPARRSPSTSPAAPSPCFRPGPNDASQLTRSVTYGYSAGQTMGQVFSSSLPSTSPYYIAPADFNQTKTLTLTAPADLALFSGTGSLSLPVTASAWSSFFSNSGNGFGKVTTSGSASISVTYNWSPTGPAAQTVPEPAAVVLWGIGSAWSPCVSADAARPDPSDGPGPEHDFERASGPTGVTPGRPVGVSKLVRMGPPGPPPRFRATVPVPELRSGQPP